MSKKDINNKYAEAAERAQSGDLNNIELKEGQNAVRIVELDFEEIYTHYVDDTEGNTKRIVCPADIKDRKTAVQICPVCNEFKQTKDSEIRAQHRYLFNAVQGSIEKVKKEGGKVVKRIVLDNTVKLWDIGPMIFNQIAAIQMDDEIPDLDKVNLKVSRKGSGKNTEYQVLPSPKETSLPEDLTELIDIEELAEPTPIDEINRILGNEVEEEEVEEVEEEKPKKQSKKSSKKKDEEEDELEELDDLDDDEEEDLDE